MRRGLIQWMVNSRGEAPLHLAGFVHKSGLCAQSLQLLCVHNDEIIKCDSSRGAFRSAAPPKDITGQGGEVNSKHSIYKLSQRGFFSLTISLMISLMI